MMLCTDWPSASHPALCASASTRDAEVTIKTQVTEHTLDDSSSVTRSTWISKPCVNSGRPSVLEQGEKMYKERPCLKSHTLVSSLTLGHISFPLSARYVLWLIFRILKHPEAEEICAPLIPWS